MFTKLVSRHKYINQGSQFSKDPQNSTALDYFRWLMVALDHFYVESTFWICSHCVFCCGFWDVLAKIHLLHVITSMKISLFCYNTYKWSICVCTFASVIVCWGSKLNRLRNVCQSWCLEWTACMHVPVIPQSTIIV